MIAHRTIVSLGFKISSLLLGAPATLAFAVLTVIAVDFRHAAAPDGTHAISIRTYGLVGLLNNAAVGVDKVFGELSRLAEWLFAGLAIVALLIALQAVLLYLVGRGVGRKAVWARIVGGVLAVGLTLASFLALATLPHRLMAAPLPLLALAGYTLWTLVWRYSEPGVIAPPEAATGDISPGEPGR